MADNIVSVKLRTRYDTAANWTSNNPVLLGGELGIESDTLKMKVGNGSMAWSSLPYLLNGSAFQAASTITVNTGASPALGTVANNTEYRCTNTSPSTAPSMTIASISSTGTELVFSVVFKAPSTTAPTITNNSGKTIKYKGDDVSNGVFAPVTGTVYRMSFVFDGIYLNCYITGIT